MRLLNPKIEPDIVYMRAVTQLGDVLLAARGMHLVGVWFDLQQHLPNVSTWAQVSDHPVLAQAHQQLQQYFSGQRQQFELPLAFFCGTPFQQQVWSALQAIPYGHTVSYGELAQRVSRPSAVRAVGAAIGRNPLSLVIPCHRVVGANGALTGYAGGIARKQALLTLESTHR